MPGAFGPPEQPQEIRIAVQAWNVMGGIDWAALPIVAELLGIADIEKLNVQLVALRDLPRD